MKSKKLTIFTFILLVLMSGIQAAQAASSGSVLVFPFYTSGVGADTVMTITNNNTNMTAAPTAVHILMVDGSPSSDGSCEQLDYFACLAPGASEVITASVGDPMIECGYLIAVAVDPTDGHPIDADFLSGQAVITTPTLNTSYTAECFAARRDTPNDPAIPADKQRTATLKFGDDVANDNYDAVATCLTTTVQKPSTLPGQMIVTVGLQGDLNASLQTGSAQSGTGYIRGTRLVSYSRFLTGTCQSKATITDGAPRVAFRMNNIVGTTPATMYIPVRAAVGVKLLPTGTSPLLTKAVTGAAQLKIPVFMPDCM